MDSRRLVNLCGLALIVLLTGCGRWGAARHNRQHYALTEKELVTAYPWLDEFIPAWQQEVDFAAGNIPGYSDLGCFPVGNGYVFAYEGLKYPLGTIDNIIGPEYQKSGGFFGEVIPALVVHNHPVAWSQQSIKWIKPAGIVTIHSVAESGLGLTTYDFACADLPALVRVVVATNNGERPQPSVAVALTFTTPAAEEIAGDILITRGDRRMRCGALGTTAIVSEEVVVPELPAELERQIRPTTLGDIGTSWRCELGALEPGESVAKLTYLIFSTSPTDEQDTLNQISQRGFDLLDDAHQYWCDWHKRTTSVECSDEKVAALLDIEKYLCAVQQAYEGGFSPMDGYSYTWVRDSNGPIRYLLACGEFEAVKRHLEYHFKGCAQQQRIGNNLPLDLQFEEETVQPDWSEVPVERAEVPSFVILQHYWYYKYTGDLDLIERHWPYLVRCLKGQQVDERGTLPFHGDETYRFPGYQLFNAGRDASDYVSLEACSADSAFEYVAAAEALAQMATARDRSDEAQEYQGSARSVRRATERLYWQGQVDDGFYAPAMSDFSSQVHRYPFAPINMRPLWIGYAEADQRQGSNVLNALKYLWKQEGTITLTPSFGYYVPMTVGYVLYNLAEIGHPTAEMALQGVLRAAEASGGYAEMNEPNDRPSDEVWGQNRVRPWEGGINAQAILHYLTGLKADAPQAKVSLRPWMPQSWEWLKVSNLRVGDFRLRLEVDRQRCVVTRDDDSDKVLTLDLTVPLYGKLSRLAGNWQEHSGRQAASFSRYGQHWVRIDHIELGPHETVSVLPEYARELPMPETTLPEAMPFEYGPPEISGSAQVLLLTWSKETAEEYRNEYGSPLATLDTKIAFPPEFLRAALVRADGSRRVDTVILDVSEYSGAFKRPGFWQDGPGGKILAEFKEAGGEVLKPKIVRQMPRSPWGLQRK